MRETLLDALLVRLPEESAGPAAQALCAGMTVTSLVRVADQTSAVPSLRFLARHASAKVRSAVARNPACPDDVLVALSADAAKSVARLARAHVMWRALAGDDPQVPAYSRQASADLQVLFASDSFHWFSWQTLAKSFARLLSDPEWLADEGFIRWVYADMDALGPSTAEVVGAERLMRALLPALSVPYRESALEVVLQDTDPGEFVTVVQALESVLRPSVVSAVGKNWKDVPLGTGYLRESGWVRVAFASCPDRLVLDALNSDDDLVFDLAVAQVRRRPKLQQVVLQQLSAAGHYGEPLDCRLLSALDDACLLDAPFAALQHTNDPDDGCERMLVLLAQEMSLIVRDVPDAWQTLKVLSEDFYGSVRELLAAVRTL